MSFPGALTTSVPPQPTANSNQANVGVNPNFSRRGFQDLSNPNMQQPPSIPNNQYRGPNQNTQQTQSQPQQQQHNFANSMNKMPPGQQQQQQQPQQQQGVPVMPSQSSSMQPHGYTPMAPNQPSGSSMPQQTVSNPQQTNQNQFVSMPSPPNSAPVQPVSNQQPAMNTQPPMSPNASNQFQPTSPNRSFPTTNPTSPYRPYNTTAPVTQQNGFQPHPNLNYQQQQQNGLQTTPSDNRSFDQQQNANRTQSNNANLPQQPNAYPQQSTPSNAPRSTPYTNQGMHPFGVQAYPQQQVSNQGIRMQQSYQQPISDRLQAELVQASAKWQEELGKMKDQYETEMQLMRAKLTSAVNDFEAVKQQLYSKEEEEDKHKKEIDRLSVQLAFKEKELKEAEHHTAAPTEDKETTDQSKKSPAPAPVIKIPHSSHVAATDQPSKKATSGQKRTSKSTEQPDREEPSKKQKADVDKENDTLRKNVTQLKHRLKVVKRALEGEYDREIKSTETNLREEISEVMKRELERFNKELRSSVDPNFNHKDTESELKNLRGQIKELTRQLELSEKQVSDLQADKMAEAERSKALIAENEHQRENILNFFNKTVHYEQQIENLLQEKNNLIKEIEQLAEQSHFFEGKCKQLQEALGATKLQSDASTSTSSPSNKKEEKLSPRSASDTVVHRAEAPQAQEVV